MRLFVTLFSLVLAFQAKAAYFQADLPTSGADPELGVHLIITGKGMEVGDQWLRAGHTQALIFGDRKVHGTVRYIGGIEGSQTVPMLKKWGYQNIQVFNQTYTGPQLVKQILLNPKVASIDFIGHNGAILGFALEDFDHRFFKDDVKALAPLAARMGPDSFIRLMGCNTGWNLAPLMAQVLKVPVSGSFTFADIENLFDNRDWYYHDKGRYPDAGAFVSDNDVSFSRSVHCEKDGGCTRLKPVRINYQGKHGNYSGTVPFLKTFCGALATEDCFRRMALSTTYLVGNEPLSDVPTPEQYTSLLADHFCPSYIDPKRKQACVQGIVDHLNQKKLLPKSYTTSDGPTLNCDFQNCAAKVDCSSGTCVMIGTFGPKPATTFVDELNAYRQGYETLRRSH